ncbi:MAG: hypothetical protein QOH61_2617 [Chloroflexota bacterium]|jgi:hypothetical protein|nr:hypothetical protein [Chloroflexota bacterium]
MSRSRRAWRGVVLAVLSAGLVLVTLPAAVSAAPSPVRIYAELSGCNWYGMNAGNRKTIAFVWKDVGGELKAKVTVKSRANGDYDVPCIDGEAIEVGDTIKATIGTRSHTFTVPRLTLSSNRDDDTVYGLGPAGSSVHVSFYSRTGFDVSEVGFNADEPTGGDGAYSHDFTADADVRGWDWVNVEWSNAHGDLAWIGHSTPTLKVWVGRPYRTSAWGSANPGTPVDVLLYDSTLNQKGTASGGANRFGYFEGDFIKLNNGGLVRAIPGDSINAVNAVGLDANWDIPSIPVTINAGTDRVSGSCEPDDGWQVEAYAGDAAIPAIKKGITNGTGGFTTDLTSVMNLKSGDHVNVFCEVYTGDVAGRHITVP